VNYQWYPGHMTKAKRQMQEDIKLIDLVIELVDARIPLSSRNPDIDELGKNKARLILLNKADLADEKKNKLWKAYFQKQGFFVVELDARKRNSMKLIQDTILESCKEKIERDRRRGIKNRPIRAMVVGIPNVGKSTFINTFAGKAVAKTGNRPGVTKGKQWIRLNKNVELLDTPGILWPKFDDQAVGMRLAWIGSMNDTILNIDELSLELIAYLKENYPGTLAERYRIPKTGEGMDASQEKEVDAVGRNQADASEECLKPVEILEQIAKSRNCIRTGGEVDYSKAAVLLMDDFRSGRLGRLTMENPVSIS